MMNKISRLFRLVKYASTLPLASQVVVQLILLVTSALPLSHLASAVLDNDTFVSTVPPTDLLATSRTQVHPAIMMNGQDMAHDVLDLLLATLVHLASRLPVPFAPVVNIVLLRPQVVDRLVPAVEYLAAALCGPPTAPR